MKRYKGRSMVRVVASYERRRRLAEEVPGLYIRRLTLEDPRSAKERSSGSRSRTPPRHICHPAGPYVSSSFFSSRGSSSYRSWQERIRKERPAYLTIISLELPEAPVPLIESLASGRLNESDVADRPDDKDDILDELLEKVSELGKERERESRGRKLDTFFRERRSRKVGSLECTKEVATLEECTRNILRAHQEGENEMPSVEEDFRDVKDCICSEIPGKLRINVRKKTEVTSASSRSPSPVVTHTIRIAMKYHGRGGRSNGEENKETGKKDRRSHGTNGKNIRERTTTCGMVGKGDDEFIREEGCCTGVNVALDFTLNCNSVRLTSRDISLKAETRDEGR